MTRQLRRQAERRAGAAHPVRDLSKLNANAWGFGGPAGVSREARAREAR